MNNIPDSLGTAVTVQSMVFGNFGDDSGSGVAFTRNPSTGERAVFRRGAVQCRRRRCGGGIRTPEPVLALKEQTAAAYDELFRTQELLEQHYRDMQDIEFTVQEGRFYILQTRSGKRTGRASVRIAVDMVREGMIDEKEALLRVSPEHVQSFLHPMVDPDAERKVIASGSAGQPGRRHRGRRVFRRRGGGGRSRRGTRSS
jgi:pyruvate,orthophosphate dikinase